MWGGGGDKTFNATFFCCYFLPEKTFRAAINNGLALFLSFSLYRQEKASIINYWHVMALSFDCYFFFFVFPLFDPTQECRSGEQQRNFCRRSVLSCTSRSRLGPFHSGVTLESLAQSGEWFGVFRPLQDSEGCVLPFILFFPPQADCLQLPAVCVARKPRPQLMEAGVTPVTSLVRHLTDPRQSPRGSCCKASLSPLIRQLALYAALASFRGFVSFPGDASFFVAY